VLLDQITCPLPDERMEVALDGCYGGLGNAGHRISKNEIGTGLWASV
jgi:hypothetical protein